jgi:hypothetical protein
MHHIRVAAAVLLAVSPPSLALAQPLQAGSAEAALASLDAHQKELVAKADIDGRASLAAPQLTINAPTNRILTREQFLAMMRDGRIGAEAFERKVESVTVTGNVGVVMGSEVFTPTAASELGRTYGVRPLDRRYTNIYVLDHGRWMWFARHANVVSSLVNAH